LWNARGNKWTRRLTSAIRPHGMVTAPPPPPPLSPLPCGLEFFDTVNPHRLTCFTRPDPQKLSGPSKFQYTVKQQIKFVGPEAQKQTDLYNSTDRGGVQLCAAAYVDPTLRKFHFGEKTHRFLRYHVSTLWYLLPFFGPPSDTVELNGAAQSWRLNTWPRKDGETCIKERMGTPHVDAGAGWAYGREGPIANVNSKLLKPEYAAEDRMLWRVGPVGC
jgi:hypothetical protein